MKSQTVTETTIDDHLCLVAMKLATLDVDHATAQILGDIKTENPALVISADLRRRLAKTHRRR
ncbi:MAG: hypothetical protein ACRCUY_12020 [Thermoguttaceae bacterium]